MHNRLHPSRMVTCGDFAAILMLQGNDLKRSGELFELALDCMDKTLGTDHPDTVTCLCAQSEFYIHTEQFEKALQSLSASLTNKSQSYENITLLLNSMERLGDEFIRAGKNHNNYCHCLISGGSTCSSNSNKVKNHL